MSEPHNRALVLIKPEAVQRQIVGRVISMLEEKGLRIVGLKLSRPSRSQVAAIYESCRNESFFDDLVESMSSHPCVMIAVEVDGVSPHVSEIVGAVDRPGTIRGRFAPRQRFNVIHCSEDPATAHAQVSIVFEEEELAEYDSSLAAWL